MSNANNNLRPVIVCTEYRAVFFGFSSDTSGVDIHLKDARMIIAFGTTRGVMQLAETGPTANSRISAKANVDIRKVTAVFEVTDTALAVWENVK